MPDDEAKIVIGYDELIGTLNEDATTELDFSIRSDGSRLYLYKFVGTDAEDNLWVWYEHQAIMPNGYPKLLSRTRPVRIS